MNLLHFTQPESPVYFFPRVSWKWAARDGISVNLTSTICSLQPFPTNTNQKNLDLKITPNPEPLLFTGYITAFRTRSIQNLPDSTLQDFLLSNISCVITTTTSSKFKLLLPTWQGHTDAVTNKRHCTSLRLAFCRKYFKARSISVWFFHISGHRSEGTLPTYRLKPWGITWILLGLFYLVSSW